MDNTQKNEALVSSVEILDDIVVDQIAAGEVVERPASVVKELVENSLDAGSTEIIISLKAAGQESISIQDNGHGMSKEDALKAIKRFGTSKIKSAKDLLSISSMGFRGEAIPSIASISNFKLETKISGSKSGVSLIINGGKLSQVNELNIASGCKIVVEDLFFNVPARRKFLKTERTELAYIKSTITDIAAAFPTVRFQLLSEGKSLALFPVTSGFYERLEQIFKPKEEYFKVEEKTEKFSSEYKVSGLLSKPNFALQNSTKLRLIVNNRTVRDKLLLGAVKEGFSHYLKPGKYPKGLIKLDIPFEDVDINVHPQKSEVRFRKSDAVFRIIARAIKKSLARESSSYLVEQSFIKKESPEISKTSGEVSFFNSGGESKAEFSGESSSTKPESVSRETYSIPSELSPISSESIIQEKGQEEVNTDYSFPSQNNFIAPIEKLTPKENKLSSMRYVGQIFKCYLLFEKEDIFAILDMHAAHEIINFVKFKEGLNENPLSSQVLLLPETVELPAKHYEAFQEKIETFKRLGLDVEAFGDNKVIVRGTPSILGEVNPKLLLEDMFSVSEWASISSPLESSFDKLLSSMACHGSIRSGKELKKEQAYALVDSLEKTKGSAFCPHGRPVVQYMNKKELESRFARI